MKLAVMQPYFLPYIGYWQLLNAVDTFVVFDDVNFIKKGWINRNRLLENGNAAFFNIYLRHASQNKFINQIERMYDEKLELKMLKRIESCYRKAPYFLEIYPIIEDILLDAEENLAEYLFGTICCIADYLEIETSIVKSSDIDKKGYLKGQEKILDICKTLGADTYYNAIGGKALYNKEIFAKDKIALFFLETQGVEYPQFENVFVPALSIMDVLMFNGKAKTKQYLTRYVLD